MHIHVSHIFENFGILLKFTVRNKGLCVALTCARVTRTSLELYYLIKEIF